MARGVAVSTATDSDAAISAVRVTPGLAAAGPANVGITAAAGGVRVGRPESGVSVTTSAVPVGAKTVPGEVAEGDGAGAEAVAPGSVVEPGVGTAVVGSAVAPGATVSVGRGGTSVPSGGRSVGSRVGGLSGPPLGVAVGIVWFSQPAWATCTSSAPSATSHRTAVIRIAPITTRLSVLLSVTGFPSLSDTSR